MKVFVVGATGAVGKRLVPGLVARGHEVVGTTRSPKKAQQVRGLGAQPAVVEGLDGAGVLRAVMEARPDVIVHQLTSLSRFKSPKALDEELAATNRLRTAGLDHVLAAARAAGTPRVIAQSFTGWPNVRDHHDRPRRNGGRAAWCAGSWLATRPLRRSGRLHRRPGHRPRRLATFSLDERGSLP